MVIATLVVALQMLPCVEEHTVENWDGLRRHGHQKFQRRAPLHALTKIETVTLAGCPKLDLLRVS
jgi:hypothetical protein